MNQSQDGAGPSFDPDQLPPRVRRVLQCLLEGLSEKEAARALQLTPHTVHSYVKILYRQLGVRSRAQLLARCLGRAPLTPAPDAGGAGAVAGARPGDMS